MGCRGSEVQILSSRPIQLSSEIKWLLGGTSSRPGFEPPRRFTFACAFHAPAKAQGLHPCRPAGCCAAGPLVPTQENKEPGAGAGLSVTSSFIGSGGSI